MSKIVVGWTWKQAVAFLVAWAILLGPWLYMVWRMT